MITKLSRAREILRREGARELLKRGTRHYGCVLRQRLEPQVTRLRGRYLFDHGWDLAIVLDGCRHDLAGEVTPGHPVGLGVPRAVYSVGSYSADWIERTFKNAPERVLAGTAYVSANPFTDRAPGDTLQHVDRVYRYGWDPELGTVPPRPVTDRAIRLLREGTANRYLVHYMQPHLPPLEPSIPDYGRWEPTEGLQGDVTGRSGVGWDLVQSGADPEPIVRDYRDNLRPVLDDLRLLLDNVDASKVIVTADHGNYLGENGRWGHSPRHVHPAVRRVPWWETDASDERTYVPGSYDRTNDTLRGEQLEALGYR